MISQKEIIILGADHAGFEIKEYIKALLLRMDYRIEDVGTFGKKSVDYPDYVEKAALLIREEENRKGILVCGTGIGASIAANKISGIRAALVSDEKTARLSREHNDANVLVLGGRSFNENKVEKILKVWLKSKFKGGRHKRRLDKISEIEKKNIILLSLQKRG